MNGFFTNLPKHVKYMTREELLRYFPPNDTTNAFLMRSIIMNEKSYYVAGNNNSRTLRGVWYSTVKPTLDKLGLLTADDQTEEGLTKWDATLSKYMAQLLRQGYLLYSDLGIYDTSRRKQNPTERYYTADSATYGYKANIAPYSNIIIATEKDTVYDIIKQTAEVLGCSCISCKGQNALGAMEGLIKGMNLENIDTIHILTMTDYDPAGYYIADALAAQARDIVDALDIGDIAINYARIGITPDQLSPEMVEANKYTPKPANMEKWLEKTGGIDGEPKGLELDALDADQIREIFVENIREYIDPTVYWDFVKEAFIKEKLLESIKDDMDELARKVIAEVEEYITVDEFNVCDLAKQGSRSIPAWALCRIADDVDQDIVRNTAQQYFNLRG